MSAVKASNVKARDLPKPAKIVSIASYTSMENALKTLQSNHILSAPVLDLEGALVGQIDLVDIIVVMVHLSKKTQEVLVSVGLMGEEEQIDFSRVRVDRPLKELLQSTDNVGSLANFSSRNPLRSLGENATLQEVVKELVSRHRICILNSEGKLTNYVTQSAMMKYLKAQPSLLGSLAGKTIGELGIGTSPVISVKKWDSVIEAFKLITLQGVSAVAVVDDQGHLVGTLGAHDVRSINPAWTFIEGLVVKAEEYLTTHTKNPVLVTEATTLAELVEKLQGRHRALIIDAEKRPVKVISIGDVLKALV